MSREMIYLASDNLAAVHPIIMNALVDANKGYASPYGEDNWTKDAEILFQEILGTPCKILFVPTGTGSNVLALHLACKKHESVICSDIAHLHHQESGAAEAIVGCKLITVPHLGGKLTPENVLKRLRYERAFGRHSTSPRVLSITQPTEVGTVYTLSELNELSKLCKEENLLLHMDGSRLYNAIVNLKVSFKEICHNKIDLLSLGGTKNGLMYGELLAIFNPLIQEGAEHLQKQTLQLMSKMRFLTAQYMAFFENDLWKSLALHANQKAKALASILEAIPSFSLSYPVQTNQIFVTVPRHLIPLIQEKIVCYLWNDEKNELRFITSWATTDKDIKGVEELLKKLSHQV